MLVGRSENWNGVSVSIVYLQANDKKKVLHISLFFVPEIFIRTASATTIITIIIIIWISFPSTLKMLTKTYIIRVYAITYYYCYHRFDSSTENTTINNFSVSKYHINILMQVCYCPYKTALRCVYVINKSNTILDLWWILWWIPLCNVC